MKLYEIPVRYQKWLDKVEENDGEISDVLADQLLDIESDLSTKTDAYCAMIKKFKYEEDAYKEEARRLTVKANAAWNCQVKLRIFLLHAMRSMSVDKIRGSRFSISRLVNKIPSIVWDSNQPIPERFQRVQISLDGKIAHEVLKDEGSLPEGFKISNTEYVRIT